MKRTIVLLSAVLLVSTMATAGVSNPDDFESYALTNAWAPTEAGEGWVTEAAAPGNHHDIRTGTNGNATTVYSQDSTNRDGAPEPPGSTGQNLTGYWFANIPDADVPVTKTHLEFQMAGNYYGDQFRLYMGRDAGVYWAFSWGVTIDRRTPKDEIEFRTYDYNEGDIYSSEFLPTVLSDNTWYVLEAEE